MKKKILGTSDAWLTSCLSYQPSEPAYYIVDCQILVLDMNCFAYNFNLKNKVNVHRFQNKIIFLKT